MAKYYIPRDLKQTICSAIHKNVKLSSVGATDDEIAQARFNSLSSPEEGNALVSELGIPEGYKIFASGVFGYAAVEAPAAAPRKENTVNIIK